MMGPLMKTLLASMLGVGATVFVATSAQAQLPAQPFVIPSDGDYGSYAVQDQAVGPEDEALAKSYDNFTLTAGYHIEGISWSGIYAEPLPVSPSETDFLIEIWADADGKPNLAVPLHTIGLNGGTAGTSGPDVSVTALGHTSPATNATPGGGPAFGYDASLSAVTLPPGDYWISVLADQRFDNQVEIDPEWQWHLGMGPSDGFYAFDRLLDPVGTPEYGFLQEGKDLAFELRGTLVPEPSAIGLAMLATLSALAFRRRRTL